MSIGRCLPQQVDRPEEGCSATGGEKLHLATLSTLLYQSRFMQSFGMFGCRCHVDAALDCDFIDAQIAARLQQTDDFDPAVVG